MQLTLSSFAVSALFAATSLAQSLDVVSTSFQGTLANGASEPSGISADGRYVCFQSAASNLVPGDDNGAQDVFRHDRYTRKIVKISASWTGSDADGSSHGSSISADGNRVAFTSFANNLVPNDTNGLTDAFVRDVAAGTTTRVNVSTSGQQANDWCPSVSLSGNGAVVAFVTDASNLVPGDTNGLSDVFVRDLASGVTERVSLSASGAQLTAMSSGARLSHDGRFVAFTSLASDIVPGDTNGIIDLFVRDRVTSQTRRVNVSSSGAQANGETYDYWMTGDGRYVAFTSSATNLVVPDVNGEFDVFVHDLMTGTTELASISSAGAQADFRSQLASISGDGRYVTFTSWASNLVPGDSNLASDIFRRDRATGVTQRVSAPASGQSNGPSYRPVISDDGSVIVFESDATNLQAGDTNGVSDVFAYDDLLRCFVDADGDGYGDADTAIGVTAAACAPGRVANGRDCDDSDPARNPAASEACDGVDNDCDLEVDEDLVTKYCASSVTQIGCSPSIDGLGAASASALSGFEILVSSAPGQRSALIFYGLAPLNVPWAMNSTSLLCVVAPRQRTTAHSTGGSAGSCDGVISIDWNSWRAAHPSALGSPFAANQVLYAQGWFRDPGAPQNTNLSDGLRFVLCQ